MTALILLFAGLLCRLAWTTGITIDEGSHLVSAHLYWSGKDHLEPADMPPMIKIVGGWPSHFIVPIPLPQPGDPAWQTRHEWTVAAQTFQNMNPPEVMRLLGWSRMPLLLFPIGCLLLLWFWSRQVFASPWARCAPPLAFALNPNVLAHGCLFKNDLAASFGFLLFAFRSFAFFRKPSAANAAWLGLGVLVAILSKLSMLILVPTGALVIMAAALYGRRSPWLLLRWIAIAAAVVYAGVVLAWQMDFQGLSPIELESWRTRDDVPRWFYQASTVLAPLPFPERMWRGVVNLIGSSSGDGNGIYFFGHIYKGGLPMYFIGALLLKTPISLLLLMGLGLATRRTWNRPHGAAWFWILPALLYGACASVSTLQLGLRLILPAITCLTMFAGSAVDSWLDPAEPRTSFKRIRMLPALLFATLALETGSAYPHFLPYFNLIAPSPERAIRYLSDSNLDWGQSLPPLARFLDDHPEVPKVRIYYHGLGWPGRWLTEERIELMPPPWSEDLVRDRQVKLQPGYYAISATFLTGQLFHPEYRDYFAPFRNRKPFATPGGCIFLYRIDPGEQ